MAAWVWIVELLYKYQNYFWWFVLIINMAAFIMYGIDKNRAKKHKWRIPEVQLLGVAVMGGGAGASIGMSIFRHKTRHTRFKIIVPLCFVIQMCFVIMFLMSVVSLHWGIQ